MSGQQHAPTALYPRERPDVHFTGGWLGPRAGLDGWPISSQPGFDPAHSQSLYQLSYQAHTLYIYIYICVCVCVCVLYINYRKDQKCMTFPQCQAFQISLEIPLFHKANENSDVVEHTKRCSPGIQLLSAWIRIDIHPLNSETKTHPSVSPPSPGLRIWLSLAVVCFNPRQSYTT